MSEANALPLASIYGNFTTLGLVLFCLIALSLSAYVKIAVVLGILRAGLGFSSIPSAFVTGALAITLSYCVMYPVLKSSSTAMDEVLRADASISDQTRIDALERGLEEWATFLAAHTASQEIVRFKTLTTKLDANVNAASNVESNAMRILAPAFLVSQLKEAFRIGLRIFLPFLVIDVIVVLLVSSMGVGRQVGTSLAFAGKLLLFVLCDGWALITGSLVNSFVQ